MAGTGAAEGPDRSPLLEQTGFRLSWGAIVAGMFVATALHVVFALLGLAIGMEAWGPGDRVDQLGAGLGIWTIISGIIALFVGGLVTGRLAGILTRGDGALHGVVLWSLSTILAAYLITTSVTTLVGGALGMVERTATTALGSVGQVGAAAVGQVGGIDAGALRNELDQALRETGNPALHPDTLAADAERIGDQATGRASTSDIADEVMATIRDRGGSIDRASIANVLAARTGMSRAEADRVALRVENLAGGIAEQVGPALDTAGVYAERAAEQGSEALAQASWWALLALGLSLAASVGGVVVKARE
jgi:hypothetical protein